MWAFAQAAGACCLAGRGTGGLPSVGLGIPLVRGPSRLLRGASQEAAGWVGGGGRYGLACTGELRRVGRPVGEAVSSEDAVGESTPWHCVLGPQTLLALGPTPGGEPCFRGAPGTAAPGGSRTSAPADPHELPGRGADS